jgi:hypothetical protein
VHDVVVVKRRRLQYKQPLPGWKRMPEALLASN